MAEANDAGCPVDKDCDAVPDNKFAYDGVKSTPTNPGGTYTPPPICVGTLDYSTSECAENEANYMASLMAESLNAAAGPVNVFPMLGVHSQGSTVDMVTAAGFPLSSGTPAGSNLNDAFNTNDASWRSSQLGADVLTTPAFIGYSFGTKKAWTLTATPSERYAPAAPARKQVGTLMLQQGSAAENRATQVRIEASDDGIAWKRIAVVKVPDNDLLNSIAVNAPAAYQQWRIVPLFFNGVSTNSAWEVKQVNLLEASSLAIDNIEDFFLLENRDRAYCRTSIGIKAQYDLLDVQTELAKFGINLPETYTFTVSFAMLIQQLGRPIIVGDVLELPGEIQYDTALRPVRKWLEVTDTAWATEGYTYNWKPQLFKFYAQPILPSIEHKDLLGAPGKVVGKQSDDDLGLLGLLQNTQGYQAAEAIKQEVADQVPQTGSDPQDIQSGRSLIKPYGSYDGRDLYVQDAIPPNGAPYTVGDQLPDASTIENGHYHRQTYTMFPPNLRMPERLLKWNVNAGPKGRWQLVEVNTRGPYESHRKTVSSIISSVNRINPDDKP